MAARKKIITVKIEVPTYTVREALKDQKRMIEALDVASPHPSTSRAWKVVGTSIA